jgi:hypothetical protein
MVKDYFKNQNPNGRDIALAMVAEAIYSGSFLR